MDKDADKVRKSDSVLHKNQGEDREARLLYLARESGSGYTESAKEQEGIAVSNCEECVYYNYDPETDTNFCEADLDEDEMERFLRSASNACPFYRLGDEYRTARRQ